MWNNVKITPQRPVKLDGYSMKVNQFAALEDLLRQANAALGEAQHYMDGTIEAGGIDVQGIETAEEAYLVARGADDVSKNALELKSRLEGRGGQLSAEK